MATVTTSPDEPFVRSGVSWAEYIAFSDALGERRVRVTYDRGEMEYMPVSLTHERVKSLVGRLVLAVTEELDIDIACGGNATFRREDLERGLEPDACYWIAHEEAMRALREIDLRTDPPPDLVIEVEISRSALNRMGIYAALGVPEVWRCDGQRLSVWLRAEDGNYHESPRGHSFPFLPVTELMRFVHLAETISATKMMHVFRTWVREQQAQGWPSVG